MATIRVKTNPGMSIPLIERVVAPHKYRVLLKGGAIVDVVTQHGMNSHDRAFVLEWAAKHKIPNAAIDGCTDMGEAQ